MHFILVSRDGCSFLFLFLKALNSPQIQFNPDQKIGVRSGILEPKKAVMFRMAVQKGRNVTEIVGRRG